MSHCVRTLARHYVLVALTFVLVGLMTRATAGPPRALALTCGEFCGLYDMTAQAAGAPPAVGKVAAYDLSTSEHIFYLAADSHIHELYGGLPWNPPWTHNDPMAEATKFGCGGAPPAVSDPTAFALNGTQHVFYRATDGHIHELYWVLYGATGHWCHNDPLAEATKFGCGGLSTALGTPTSYPLNGMQYVYYRNTGGHIQELYWQLYGASGHWCFNDPVTEATTFGCVGVFPAAVGDPASYTGSGDHHVFYRATDGHIHELYWVLYGATGHWCHNDPVAEATTFGCGGAPAAVGNPAGNIFNGTQHVFYRAADGHIHELYWQQYGVTGHWCHNDPVTEATQLGCGGAPAAVGDPSSDTYPTTDLQHVFYRATDGRIHALVEYPTGTTEHWCHTDPFVGAPTAAGDPTSYANTYPQHLLYRTTDGHIDEVSGAY